MVRTIKLNDGKSIPALGWGSGTGGVNKDSNLAIDTGVVALKNGIKHIDTAQGYKTEAEAAKSIQKAGMSKGDVWITTKFSNKANTPEEITSAVKESLSKLDFIPDLFLVHNPYVTDKGNLGKFWQVLEGLVEDGTLKGCSLGVSNFRVQDFEEVLKVAKIKPTVNQLEYHPYVLEHLEPVLALQDKHKIVTQAYGPLTPVLRHPTGGPLKPVLSKIAKKLSGESGQEVDEGLVLLLWTINKGVVAVTSSKRESNIVKMAGIENLRDLTPEEINEIESVGRKIHFRSYKEHMWEDFPTPNLPEDL